MEAKPQPGIHSMPLLVHVKFRARQRTKPLLYVQELQENKNQTKKANLQIRLGVLKQVCNTQLRVSEFSVSELVLTYKAQRSDSKYLQVEESRSRAAIQKKRSVSDHCKRRGNYRASLGR